MARTACLICFISNVNGCSEKKKPIKTGTSSGHIKTFNSLFWRLSISMVWSLIGNSLIKVGVLTKLTAQKPAKMSA